MIARLGKSLRTHGLLGTLRIAVGMVVLPLLQPLRKWWVSRYLRVAGRRFDRQFHVDTSGWIDNQNLDGGENSRHATAYVGLAPGPFREVMAQLKIDFEKYVFIDFGSGKGRALLMASEYPFAKIVGVEFSRPLHECAESNCRSYKNPAQKCKSIDLCCMDASQFELPYRPSVLFFFNPFGEEIMRPIAEKLRTSLQTCRREVLVVYFWPTARKVWDELKSLDPVPLRQPNWAWPAHSGREVVAAWAAKSAI